MEEFKVSWCENDGTYTFVFKYGGLIIKHIIDDCYTIDRWESLIDAINYSEDFTIETGYDRECMDIISISFPKECKVAYTNAIQEIVNTLKNDN
jgi:hypothetical protein